MFSQQMFVRHMYARADRKRPHTIHDPCGKLVPAVATFKKRGMVEW